MNIVVIGCGTMGIGIMQVAAINGCSVLVIDSLESNIERAKNTFNKTLENLERKGRISNIEKISILDRITWNVAIEAIKAFNPSLVIEAIVEVIDVKKKVFQQIEPLVSEDCILASNTSSLSITSIASACQCTDRFIGIHFFNPAPLMALVEIVPAIQTSQNVIDNAQSIIEGWKKITVIAKDTPGFIVNRIARPYYSEAIRIYEEGTPLEIIDIAMTTLGGFKMGPFELMDLIGHDINYAVTESVWTSFYFDTKYTPSFTQKRLVEANWLGKKTGKGFYDYGENSTVIHYDPDLDVLETIKNRIIAMLVNEAANALQANIASKEDIDMAMTKGVNYPKGLLQWADEIGSKNIVNLLDSLYNHYHEDRYRCCSLLRNMSKENKSFYPSN